MKKYTVRFEDTFSFAVDTRTGIILTDEQYKKAVEDMKNRRVVVVSRFDKKNHIHQNLILKSIYEE